LDLDRRVQVDIYGHVHDHFTPPVASRSSVSRSDS
jgi:hypothetical protein